MIAAEATGQSTVSLRRTLRPKDYFTLSFGSMVGVGWMVVIDEWLSSGGSVGAILGFLIGGLALFPIGYVYGKLTAKIPDSGSEIAYTAAVFPQSVSFATGWIMVLAYLIVCPYEAVAIGKIGSYVFPQLNSIALYSIAGRPVYLPHVIIGLLVTAVIIWINYRGVNLSATFQNIATFGLLAIFAIFSILGFSRGSFSNLPPLFADGRGSFGALLSTLAVIQIVPYFMTGFEAAPKCSEEAHVDVDSRSFLRVIYLALGAGIFFYVVVIAVVSLLQPWQSLPKGGFATAVAFERAFGSKALVRFIMFGALLSLLKIFNGNFLTSTRMIFAMGRRNLLDRHLGLVHEQFRTPRFAILFVGGLTVMASFLGQAVLVPISEVGSLACAVGWLASCAAFCRGAGGAAATVGAKRVGVTGGVVALLLIAIKLIPAVPGSFRAYEYIALAGWCSIGVFLWLGRPRPQRPRR